MVFIDPIFLEIGPISIHYYGLVYAIGLVIVYMFLQKFRERFHATEEQVSTLIFFLFLGLLVGGRVGHFLIDQPMALLTNPLILLYIWQGGMSFFGAVLGMVFFSYIYCQKQSLSFMRIADYVVIPATLVLVFGRIANFINQELVGRETTVAWCVEFVTATGCRHPYQLYASFSHLLLFGLLLFIFLMYPRLKELYRGLLFSFFLIGYSFFRFFTDFFREDTLVFFQLTIWQLISIIFFIIGIYLAYNITQRKEVKHGHDNTRDHSKKKRRKSKRKR
ncbi:MAG: prolipoprotein diacylglyceryl transferase [Candidatus Woesearchaeota archaeon]